MRTQSAFTLVELLIVTIVIGILVGIAIPSYQNALLHSKASAACTTLNSIREAQLGYFYAWDSFAMDIGTLETHATANFPDSGASDGNWTYMYVFNADTFTATATKNQGAHVGETLIINETGWDPAGTYNGPGDPI